MTRSMISSVLLLSLVTLTISAARAEEDLSLEEVQREIEARGYHWTAGPTSISEMGWDALKATLLLQVPDDYDAIPKVDFSRLNGKQLDLPERWDWRELEGTTPIKHQGPCGSCWAFACVAALEACVRISDSMIYDLSEQQVLSCNSYGYGCNGGWFDACFEVFESGAVGEDCMPYLANDTFPCATAGCEILVRASEMIYLDKSIESIKAAVYQYGPVACAMTVFSDFRYYTGGCYEKPRSAPLNHAIVIVGWDNQACGGNGAWICKNSWGSSWGEGGWFTIRYGNSGIGGHPTLFIPERVITVETEPLQSTTDETSPFHVVAKLHSNACAPIDPDSAVLTYRVNGGDWTRKNLEPTGEPGMWAAWIPRQRMPATIDYHIRAVDVDGRPGEAPPGAPDSCYSFDVARVWEDFERVPPGWVIGDVGDDATSGIWECVDPVGTEAQPDADHTPAGKRCWITGQHSPDQGTGFNDVDAGRTTLRTSGYELSLTTTAILKYWRWFSNNRGGSPGQDAWVVQARNKGGPWVDIENTVQSSNAWVEVKVDLADLFDAPLGLIELRFIASDLGDGSCIEAAVDDLAILADPLQLSATQWSSPSSVWLGEAMPNPMMGGATLRFAVTDGLPIRLGIYRVDGRLVRSLVSEPAVRGSHQIWWDGRDNAGSPVASGTYYSILEAGGERTSRTLVIIR